MQYLDLAGPKMIHLEYEIGLHVAEWVNSSP